MKRYLKLLLSMSCFMAGQSNGMELPSPDAHSKIPSLKDLSSSYIAKNIKYILRSHPDAIKKLTQVSDLSDQLHHKIVTADTFKNCVQIIPCSSSVHTIQVLDESQQIFAAGFGSGDIGIFDVKNNGWMHVLKGHKDIVYSINKLAPNKIISSGLDGTIRLWNLDSENSEIIGTHDKHVYSTCLLNDQTLISSSLDNTIKIWDIPHKACLDTILLDEPVGKLRLLPGNNLLARTKDGNLQIWHLESGTNCPKLSLKTTIGSNVEQSLKTNYSETLSLIAQLPEIIFTADQADAICFQHNPELLAYVKNIDDLQKYAMEGFFAIMGSGHVGVVKNQEGRQLGSHAHHIFSYAQLDPHHIITGSGDIDGAYDHEIKIWNIGETYNLPDLLTHLKEQDQLASSSNAPENAAANSDMSFLLEQVSLHTKTAQHQVIPRIEQQRQIFLSLQNDIKQLTAKKKEADRQDYLFSLLEHAIAMQVDDIQNALEIALCDIMPPVSKESWDQLPINLSEHNCLAFITADNQVTAIPELIAVQSPVLYSLMRNTDTKIKIIQVPAEYDAACMRAIKTLLRYRFDEIKLDENRQWTIACEYENIFEKVYFDNDLEYNDRAFTRLLYRCPLNDITISPQTLILADLWELPQTRLLAYVLLSQAAPDYQKMKALFQSLPSHCYHYFMPILLTQPHIALIPWQLAFMTDFKDNVEEYNALYEQSERHKIFMKNKQQDPEERMRIIRNRYVNFINRYMDEIIQLHPDFREYLQLPQFKYLFNG